MRITLTVLLLMASSVFGQTGTITGRVVNESGQPLPNTMVTVHPIGAPHGSQHVTTDREGKFQINDLEPLSYRVFAFLSAYTSLADFADVWSTSYRVGDSVTVVLTKGGVITGTVTTQAGEPVAGIRVYARMTGSEAGHLFRQLSPYHLERTTDDRGIYRIYGLATGTYVVWAGGSSAMGPEMDAFYNDAPTYSPASTRDTAAQISVRAGQETTGVNITYRGEPGRIVSGTLRRSEAGGPMAFGVSLTAAGKSKSEWALFTQGSETQGFLFRGVDDGDYDITVLSTSPAGQTAIGTKRIKVRGADVTGIEMVAQPLALVSGRVVLEESRAAECPGKQRPLFTEMLVSASPDETQVADYHPQIRLFLSSPVHPDAQGNVSLKSVLPGRYVFVLQFSAKYWYLQSIALGTDIARTWTTLKAGDRLAGLTITLAQGAASLQGQLMLKQGETQPEGAFVYLVPAEPEKGLDVLRYFTTAANADGKIAVSNIAPGRYWVLVKSDAAVSSVTKLRAPDQLEFRAKLRREAEAANTKLEFKPCQDITGFQLPYGSISR